MILQLTGEQEQIVATIRKFVEREIIPVAAELERKDEYPFEIVDRTQALGCLERPTNFVFATLVVGRRAEPARRRTLKFNALEEAVKRQVEVEPRLFAVGDHVEPGGVLVVHRCGHGIVDHLLAVGVAEFLEVLAGELKPAGERVAADDGRAQRLLFHAKGIEAALGRDFKLGA